MKLSPLAFASTSLACLACLACLTLSAVATTGCASDVDPSFAGGEGEDTSVSQDELRARAAQFVGAYSWRAADSGDFVELEQLTLKGDGRYAAMVDAGLVNPAVRCIAFPCTLPESGAWRVVKSGGKLKVRLEPSGGEPSRSYFASIESASRTLTLARNGRTTMLFSDSQSCANVRCAAGTHCEMKGINGGAVPACIADAPPPPPCNKTGCSGQICSDHAVFSTCQMLPEYACYHAAACERQPDGECGFTPSAVLTSCLANAQQ